MSIRTRLERLEQRALVDYETLVLPDGEEISYAPEDGFDALAALLSGEDHWLLPFLRRAEPTTELPGIIRALECSR